MFRRSWPGGDDFDSHVTVSETKPKPTRHLASSFSLEELLLTMETNHDSRIDARLATSIRWMAASRAPQPIMLSA
jgi:hypothetical protein